MGDTEQESRDIALPLHPLLTAWIPAVPLARSADPGVKYGHILVCCSSPPGCILKRKHRMSSSSPSHGHVPRKSPPTT